jgi:hypothetical protein
MKIQALQMPLERLITTINHAHNKSQRKSLIKRVTVDNFLVAGESVGLVIVRNNAGEWNHDHWITECIQEEEFRASLGCLVGWTYETAASIGVGDENTSLARVGVVVMLSIAYRSWRMIQGMTSGHDGNGGTQIDSLYGHGGRAFYE